MPTCQLYVVAYIKAIDKFAQKYALVDGIAHMEADDVLVEIHRCAHAIDAGNGTDHDDVAAPR